MHSAKLPPPKAYSAHPQPKTPPTLGAMLHFTQGVGDSKALWAIRERILPFRARIIDTVRFLISGHAFTAEWDLIRALAECRSGAEIEAAFFEYHAHPNRSDSKVRRLVIGTPCQQSALSFYRSLKSDWRSRTGA